MSGTVSAMHSMEAGKDRPLIVLIDPKWNFQQDHFEVERFFEEAKITDESITVLRTRFNKFCSYDGPNGAGDAFLTLEDFTRLNKHYAICRNQDEEHYFRAMDRVQRQRLYFDDFLLGCSAANPATPHILNSFTGFVRARYIFDFYNMSRSGCLDFEELARMLADARRHLDEDLDVQRRHAIEVAQELGEVSVVTLRVRDRNGNPLCDFRASTHWTGHKVRREIARELQVPVDDQELIIGKQRFASGDVLDQLLDLDQLLELGAASVDVVASVSWGQRSRCPRTPTTPCITDGMRGLERLVHVSFDSFYKALTGEQLRGTSRLFRFHRQILHSRNKSSAPTVAAIGGA